MRDEDPVIFWFRQDLRLSDNPALSAAVRTGRPLVTVYILDDETPGRWRPGGAARWWLHHSLEALARGLSAAGGRLVLRRGRAADVMLSLVHETGARHVYWNRCYEPFAMARDEAIRGSLAAIGVETHTFNGSLLHEPWTIRHAGGLPFRVFSAFWRVCRRNVVLDAPLPAPRRFGETPRLASDDLHAWGLLPTRPNWAEGFKPLWQPGEKGAQRRLETFLEETAERYAALRDRPDLDATSRLSPHLHFGEVSPRQVWHAISFAQSSRRISPEAAETFLSELGWREFAHHLLHAHPDMPEKPLREEFVSFPWRSDRSQLVAWQRGLTGYPIVDAGMRELWTTGWMHNRVRMITASFLVKHLLVDWREGEAWFWDTLVDADLANNAMNWQWVAGSGADAAPYFRIFNPVLQGEKFDPDGVYVRRWVPELAALPPSFIHKPWLAPASVLAEAGVVLGKTFPNPIIDHATARRRALAAFARCKQRHLAPERP
jgi:deoxyribodipyrimidine photo-lyase